jgi:DNA-binding MarR family transcriptional regulator
MTTAHRTLDTALPGGLDHGKMMKLLGYNLAQASIPSNKIFQKHIGAEFKLTRVEFTTLMLLSANEEVTSKKLSQALGLSAPNLTVVLERMEKRELIQRRRSDADGRVQFIELTKTGAALVRKADARSEQMEQELLKHLTPAETAMLFELLKKVAVHRRV